MKFFNFDSPFSTRMSKIGDLMILNFLFLVSCLGVITIGAALTAMYYCLFKMADNQDEPIFKMYFHSFYKNFRQSTLLSFIFLLPITVFIFEVSHILNADNNSIFLIVLVLTYGFVLGGTITFIFPLQSRFENTISMILKNSFIICLSHPLVSLCLLVLGLVFPLFLYIPLLLYRTFVLWICIGFALVAWLKVQLLRPLFFRLSD